MKKNNKGFSLVELIVVIAIMAILASIAIVSYSIYIQRAEDAADEEYLGNLLYRVELFALENQMNVHGVMIPSNEIDGPEDIQLIIGYDENDNPVYYDPNEEGNPDSSVIFDDVGGHVFGPSFQNGIFDTNRPLFPEYSDSISGGNEAHNHAFDMSNIIHKQDPTCIAEGYNEYQCDCGATKKEPIAVVDHDLEVKNSFGNYQVKVCKVCGYYILENSNGTPIVDIN